MGFFAQLRAGATAQHVRTHRGLGIAARRRRMPRQVPPKALSRAYSAALMELVRRLRPALDDALAELRPLVERARAEKHFDVAPDDGPYRALYRADIGEGAATRALIARLRARFGDAITPHAVEDLARKFAANVTTQQRIALGAQTKAALGVDVFIADSRIIPLVEAFVDANVGLVRGIGDRLASDIEAKTLNAVQRGRLWPDLAADLEQTYGMSEERARLIGRDQVGKLYADVDQARQRELGVTHFIWRSVRDERVRDEHQEFDGNKYAYADPPLNGKGEPVMPGDEPLCRCQADPVFDDILAELEE